jgi:hypothetical protein
MILLVALLAGLLAGVILALLQKQAWQVPPLRYLWLVVIGFLPQAVIFYIPSTRNGIPDWVVGASLIGSLILLLVFCWFNRRVAGIWILACGLVLNLAVIASNGGFMPISPQTASHLVPATDLAKVQIGSRFGTGKDILLLPENTRLVWFSDRFLPPAWSPYQVAFSPGDLLIAAGAFWLMLTQGKPLRPAN